MGVRRLLPDGRHGGDAPSDQRSYFDAHGRVRFERVHRDSISYVGPYTFTDWGAYEEYWYDALGRRVMKKSDQETPVCDMHARCSGYTDRIVWDGDQILWEVRASQKIGYVHAGGIDAPVGMVRNGTSIILHRNWRGLYEFSTDTDGGQTTCSPVPFSGCEDYPWPGASATAHLANTDLRDTHIWYGSLPLNQQDETGLMYRRNRYYDPASGAFTQQDPIGIAGGLNLYGYANGDPINFSDPFGLCVEEDETCRELVEFLRGFESEALRDAANRLDKYEGRVFLQEGAFSGSTNAERMVLNLGASMEKLEDGSSGLITPGRGDLAVLLAHETLHLGEDGSFYASDGVTRSGLSHPPYGPFAAREKAAYMGLNPLNPQAPLTRLRFRVYGMLTPVGGGR